MHGGRITTVLRQLQAISVTATASWATVLLLTDYPQPRHVVISRKRSFQEGDVRKKCQKFIFEKKIPGIAHLCVG